MYHLENKRAGEEIVSVVRRHWIFLLGGAKIIAILLLAIIIFYILYVMGNISSSVFISAVIIFIIFIIITGAYYLFLWKNDLYVLTTYRLIDIDQHELFRRTVTETELENIQEVTFKTSGFLHTIFKIGDVIVKTAGPKDDIILEDVPNPHLIQQDITNTCHKYKLSTNNSQQSTNTNNNKL